MKLTMFTSKGSKGKQVEFPKQWKEKENRKLLAQAIRVYEALSHPGLSKVKTRGEVSHSTRKIYKQKGTGLARHGDRAAPIFVKGGVAHGPKGVKRELSMPKKMRRKALKVALTIKAKEGQLFFIDNLTRIKKTSDAASLIEKIKSKEKSIKKNSVFTFVLSEKNKEVKIALRNLKDVRVVFLKDLNADKVFFGGVLLLDKEVLKKTKDAKKQKAKEPIKKETRKAKKK